MKCSGCGREMPVRDKRCLYCGAPSEETASIGALRAKVKSETTTSSKSTGGQSMIYGTSGEEKVYDQLEPLPPDLRHRVQEIMKQGTENQVSEDIVETRSSVAFEPGPGTMERDRTLQFGQISSGRPRRIHPFILFLIFLGSTCVVGFVMWLMM
jgi:hypothetical protein